MRNIRGSLLAKVTAIFLFIMLTISTVLSVGGVVFLALEDAYFDDGSDARETVMDVVSSSYWEKLYRYIDYILIEGWDWYEEDLEDDFGGKSNFYFEVKDEEGNVAFSNYKDVKYQRLYNRTYTDYYYENGVYQAKTHYYITAIIPETLEVKDGFYYVMQFADWIINMRFVLIIIALVSFVFMVVVFIFLMCAAGCKRGGEEAVPNFIDKIPFDVYLLGFAFIFILTIWMMDEIFYDDVVLLATLPFMCVWWLLMFISLTMTFATRAKLGTVLKNTVVAWVLRLCWIFIKALFKIMCSVPLFIKSVALYLVVCGVEMFFLAFGYWEYTFFWVLEKCVLGLVLLVLLMNLRKLLIAGRKISAGDLDYKVDNSFMFLEFKEHANNLNEISAGLQGAVDKSIKSERMKAELITNVSHDIKTPLTSIINYVDLLKREGLESENAGEYLEVLDRQSARLKKLTEDLIEASKASTGNIKVNAERLDANILLSQAVGEYEEKFTDRNLDMVMDMAGEELFIWADGRHLWRVFDNMLNNIVKYAKQDTRVYISASKVNNEISIVFKNISDAALNISSDELMERFVRGDSSRNTEGSGLGLSIAKSLTELMGGKFEIVIDGDLFKCSMTFVEKG